MKLNGQAIVFVPDGGKEAEGIARTTHLAISAHEDDIEFMAYAPIAECFGKTDKWFGGVVVTDGAGSPHRGLYADYTDEQMKTVRAAEQNKAASVGEYGFLALLGHPSSQVKNPADRDIISVLDDKNETVYYYDPSDYEYGFDTKIYGDKLYISFSNKYNSSNTVIVIDLTTFAKVLENQNLSFDLEVEDSIFVNGMIISEYYIYDIETFGIIGSYEGNVQFVLNGYLYTSQGIYDLTTLRKVYNFKYNGYAFDALIIVGDKVYVSREGQYGKYRRVLLP